MTGGGPGDTRPDCGYIIKPSMDVYVGLMYSLWKQIVWRRLVAALPRSNHGSQITRNLQVEKPLGTNEPRLIFLISNVVCPQDNV